ncbi:MAG TPA: diphthine synthase [Thermoplasmata archaeon]|nr:diphthine synthase [Thermoplasmata archaeon]
MAELWFVGLGLSDERGLSREAEAALRSAEVVFAEEYTAVAPEGTLDRLAAALGRPIERLDRPLLESERPILDALARHGRVALLVVGDPFAATTHVALRLAAERAGHDWRYVPAASILSAAAGFLGLQHYRFGRTVSLPLEEPGFAPTSPLEQIAGNRARDLHSLLLLDLRPTEGRFLTADRALGILRARDPLAVHLPGDARAAVVARVGRSDAAGFYGSIDALAVRSFGAPPHAIVVLAPTLHFEEEAALARYAVAAPGGVSPSRA